MFYACSFTVSRFLHLFLCIFFLYDIIMLKWPEIWYCFVSSFHLRVVCWLLFCYHNRKITSKLLLFVSCSRWTCGWFFTVFLLKIMWRVLNFVNFKFRRYSGLNNMMFFFFCWLNFLLCGVHETVANNPQPFSAVS